MTIPIRDVVLGAWLVLLAAHARPGWATADPLMLWEARTEQASVYLFGSIHVCRPDCYPLDKAVLRRFDKSPMLAVELDPLRPDAAAKLRAAGTLPTGERLSDRLAPADRRALSEAISALGLPTDEVAGYRPWLANALVTITSAQQLGYAASLGLDVWLMQRAAAQGKPVVELETVERQIEALSAGNEKEQLDALSLSLGMVRSGRARVHLTELFSAWQAGNIERVDAITRSSIPTGSKLTVTLIDQRNADMARRIARWLKQGRSAFVAVGAAHLGGHSGILALLHKWGYRVQRIHPDVSTPEGHATMMQAQVGATSSVPAAP